MELNLSIFDRSLKEVITLEDDTGSLCQTEAASGLTQMNFKKRKQLI